MSTQTKKKPTGTRVENRTVIEGLTQTYEFRERYYHKNPTNSKIKLEDAAKGMTIPVQTLNNYFTTLKDMYMCGYDISVENLNLKNMGDLKNFNKKFVKDKKEFLKK